jgi:pyridoxal phosphate enzyme (YggS family)
MPATLTIADNLARIEDQIAAACRRAGRSRADVALMAVSKMHPVSAILDAVAAGQTLFGENRVQEFQQKHGELRGASESARDAAPVPEARFHLIGHLQSNKAAKAAEIFDSIDTVDSLRLAQRLNEAAQKLDRVLPILIEVKLSPEESKTGLDPNADPDALPGLLDQLPDLSHLQLRGLMTVPPWSDDPETARPYFVQLRTLCDQLAAAHPRLDFSGLSMGMSGDFEVAIEEGSTCVRIGTAIFGRRAKPA